MFQIEEQLKKLQEDIAPYTPNIIAVTKYFGRDGIIEAYRAGLRNFGESRIPEATEKIASLPEEIRRNSKFHMIGHLQSNKVKKVVGVFEYIHSVDTIDIAKKISEEAKRQGIVQKVFLQINNANEEQKFGFTKQGILKEYESITKLSGIEVVGLMNIAPNIQNSQRLKELFTDIKELGTELGLKEFSMGMSNDYKEAVDSGATFIRVGRKLFS